ncbi:MAG TPA: hypothetical protein VI524_00945 [Anaerolineales bacterium]|nr:hypothetical protein [Anaerolineales bacterium]
MQSRHLNDKYGMAFLVAGCLLIWAFIFLLFKSYGYTQTWELWRVPTESPPFSDFRLIPGSAETFRMGIEPSARNPGDPHKRKFNYPTFWRLFFYTGITQADTIWISVLMIILFFTGVFLFPQKLLVSGALWMLLVIFSPAAMLLYERGNVDLIVFALCAAIVVATDYSPYAAVALLIAGTIIKLFPFFGVSVLLREPKRKFIWLAAACSLVLLIYMSVTWDSVSAAWDLTMRGKEISYGANVFFYRYGTALSTFLSQWFRDAQIDGILKIGPIILALGLALTAGISGMRNRQPLANSSQRNLAAFRMGASIYIGTFLLGNNWDYRLAFLILLLPQLLEWTRSPVSRYRSIARISLIAVLVSCWHFVLWYSPFFNSFEGSKDLWFVIDELFNWMLLSGFSYLLFASAPDWSKEWVAGMATSPQVEIA